LASLGADTVDFGFLLLIVLEIQFQFSFLYIQFFNVHSLMNTKYLFVEEYCFIGSVLSLFVGCRFGFIYHAYLTGLLAVGLDSEVQEHAWRT